MRGPFFQVWGRLLSPGLHYAEREREKGEKTSIEQLFLSCKYCLAPGPLLAPHSFLCFEILPPLEDHLQGSRLVHNAKLVSAVKRIKQVAHIKNITDSKTFPLLLTKQSTSSNCSQDFAYVDLSSLRLDQLCYCTLSGLTPLDVLTSRWFSC